ncbi:MAG TPA: glycosyltransferase [Clostridia bacterium]|nr:glycosyltransferase [Clostridia bacterium]
MHNYCTIVSKEYLHKGLMLYNSLKKYDASFRLFFICMNEGVKDILSTIISEHAEYILIEDVERQDAMLALVKASRNEKEYEWTSKASIFLYLFNNYPILEHIVWLDSDIVFFSNPEPIFRELDNCSILLTKELFKGDNVKLNNVYGVFNTGLMGFKRDIYALRSIKWFRERCIEWCYNLVLPGKWSDQMYVNDWEERFIRVRVIENIGINATPWNIQGCVINKVDNDIYLDGEKLVFYHYNGFSYFNKKEFDLCYYIELPEAAVSEIYKPYIAEWQRTLELLDSYDKTIYKEKSISTINIQNYYCIYNEDNITYGSNHFCTIIGQSYLIKGLALYLSLKQNLEKFHLWVCCMDEVVYRIMKELQLENVTLYSLDDIEDDELKSAKQNRSFREYCWTMKAPLIIRIFDTSPQVDSIIYLDADTFIFSDLSEVYQEWGNKAILLCKQRDQYNDEIFGIYQAGVIGFRKDEAGVKCLNWWRSKCIEWCYERFDDPLRWGDQKYMNDWTKLFEGVVVARSLGIDTAAWYLKYYNINEENNDIYIEKDKLNIYHFTSFYVLDENEFTLWKWWNLEITDEVSRLIYLPYIKTAKEAIQMIKPFVEDIRLFYSSDLRRDDIANFVSW